MLFYAVIVFVDLLKYRCTDLYFLNSVSFEKWEALKGILSLLQAENIKLCKSYGKQVIIPAKISSVVL